MTRFEKKIEKYQPQWFPECLDMAKARIIDVSTDVEKLAKTFAPDIQG